MNDSRTGIHLVRLYFYAFLPSILLKPSKKSWILYAPNQRVDGYIVGYATQGGFVGGIDVSIEFIQYLEEGKLGCYKYENGKAVLDQAKYDEKQNEALLTGIRQQRRTECFLIINRGNSWYDTLTSEQIEELNNWYHDWLNAPETKSIPAKPRWIKD